MAEFTIRQLQYFVAVLDHGSVTAAAKESNISQAAASMAIAQLEHAVGVDLLIRTRAKKVVATPAGVELAARARHILSMIGDLEGAVAGGFDEMRGPLRTGCSPTLSPRLLPGLVDYFSREFPAVDVSFREASAAELQQDVPGGAGRSRPDLLAAGSRRCGAGGNCPGAAAPDAVGDASAGRPGVHHFRPDAG
jgi:DNA-binding transcriptional LysR family regulator